MEEVKKASRLARVIYQFYNGNKMILVHFEPKLHDDKREGFNVLVGTMCTIELEFWFNSSEYPTGQDAEMYYKKFCELKELPS